MINGVNYEFIDDSGLHSIKNNQKKILHVDQIIICAGQLSNNIYLEKTLKVNKNTELIGGAFEALELDAKKQ